MDFLALFLPFAAVVLLVRLLKRLEELASQLRELRTEFDRHSEAARTGPPSRY